MTELRSLLNSFFEEDFWVKSTYPLFPPEEHERTQIPKMNFLQETVRMCILCVNVSLTILFWKITMSQAIYR